MNKATLDTKQTEAARVLSADTPSPDAAALRQAFLSFRHAPSTDQRVREWLAAEHPTLARLAGS